MAFLFILLLPALASAQGDSITKALHIVEEFYSVSDSRLREALKPGPPEAFQKEALAEKDEAAKRIRALGWLDKPGERRYNQAFSLVDGYTSRRLDSIEELAAGLGPKEGKKVEGIIKELELLRTERMMEFQESLNVETYKAPARRPGPMMEAPFEQEPNKEPGIWYK